MANKTKEKQSLRKLLNTKLQAIYDAETQIVKALPKMAKAASNSKLKEGFKHHLEETEGHIERLEEAFDILGEKPKKLKVDAVRGLIKDGEWVIKNVNGTEARDATLIPAARYVEHYEMAGYMGAIEWARVLGEEEVASLLEENLSEEQETDRKLATLSASLVDEVETD